jgi:hypothetical protein
MVHHCRLHIYTQMLQQVGGVIEVERFAAENRWV